jgi:hypothetical protein
MSLRDHILSRKLTVEPVDAFGTTVFVREMNSAEVGGFYRWHAQAGDSRTGIDVMLAVVLRTLCDEQGTRIFADDEADKLAQISPHDLRAVYTVAARLNAIDTDDEDVDRAEKNSEATPASAPASPSPASSA